MTEADEEDMETARAACAWLRYAVNFAFSCGVRRILVVLGRVLGQCDSGAGDAGDAAAERATGRALKKKSKAVAFPTGGKPDVVNRTLGAEVDDLIAGCLEAREALPAAFTVC